MSAESENSIHKVFQNDPKYFRSLINKNVNITTTNGAIHNGKVYVIDPVSETVVLINRNDHRNNTNDMCNIDIVCGHAIKSIELCDTNDNDVESDFSTNVSSHIPNMEEIREKRLKLKSWLNKNLIQAEEEGLVLKIGEDLTIEPPYDLEQCFSTNTIILERIQKIISKMPII